MSSMELNSTYPQPNTPPPGMPLPLAEIEEPEVAWQTNDDRELVARCAGGDGDALAEIFDRFGGLLQSLALRILGDRRDAEDVVQEALLYAWKKAPTYDPSRASVSTWLVLITRSRALDRIRQRSTAQRAQTSLELETDHRGIDPEGFGNALQQERARRVRDALHKLPHEQRQAVELQFFDGLTQREGAEKLVVPLGTFKTRVLLGVRKLRRELMGEQLQLM